MLPGLTTLAYLEDLILQLKHYICNIYWDHYQIFCT